MPPIDYQQLTQQIKAWGAELGFQQVGIADTDLSTYEPHFQTWLDNGYHADMDYMSRYGSMRTHPEELYPGTIRVISVRMDYLPPDALMATTLKQKDKGYISRYALGRDYHKIVRKRLKHLGDKISEHCETLDARPFVDTGPLLERPLAEKAGLGWTGKHSLILNKEAGSWFFLGEILINLPLPVDKPIENQCGKCTACLQICPTQAIVAPYSVDANRCISYLTIELFGPIPEQYRALIGNRIYGCDDCQLICPWNRFAAITGEKDFHPRSNLHSPALLTLYAWNETYFLKQTEGSPIRRIGHERWLRNISVALGNAAYSAEIVAALEAKFGETTAMVQEHITWALQQQQTKAGSIIPVLQIDKTKDKLIRMVEKALPRDA
ncbi:tRNA epoxyqueuosine(34) reductase QueG [Moritella sp. Urea-trap-13]|uniref:tRNA epoxyqueuosine(34) reductase QueG n=1 Tax=Moritella sp. Urea-trap-13 TaxID=2058327 RepID=UPI000C33C839|nr:tRNA epoxyqueuosine(34) reductase QueG [Moritella sp. Urea-trap-13]PKH05476.1 tRNA epoxyqueuosine(34) reductase QueG [Moritella sp. Urea-trap-13]